MTHFRIKPVLSNTPRKALCTVLALMIGLCALMIALPGFSQVLFQQSKAMPCHLSTTDILSSAQSGVTTMEEHVLPQGDTSKHHGSVSVCEGNLIVADNTNAFSHSVVALSIVLFYITALSVPKLILLHPTLRRNEGQGPPFDGHLRSHLGLSRIHV